MSDPTLERNKKVAIAFYDLMCQAFRSAEATDRYVGAPKGTTWWPNRGISGLDQLLDDPHEGVG